MKKALFEKAQRGSSLVVAATAALAVALAALSIHWLSGNRSKPQRAHSIAIAASLDLTDLALFPEARYTRHPSQADTHAPFQDGPMSLEHFPAGTFLVPSRDLPRAGFVVDAP